jgi:putative phosphoesterase
VDVTRVGLISDTHGLLRPQALAALQGCDPIIHAGDVGDPAIVDALAEIAPVFAIRGNVDRGDWARSLPETRCVRVEDRLIHVLHSLDDLDFEPEAAGFHAVIYGHSHRPSIETKRGVLYVNPGSAGPRRFDLPVTIAVLTLEQGELHARIVDIIS